MEAQDLKSSVENLAINIIALTKNPTSLGLDMTVKSAKRTVNSFIKSGSSANDVNQLIDTSVEKTLNEPKNVEVKEKIGAFVKKVVYEIKNLFNKIKNKTPQAEALGTFKSYLEEEVEKEVKVRKAKKVSFAPNPEPITIDYEFKDSKNTNIIPADLQSPSISEKSPDAKQMDREITSNMEKENQSDNSKTSITANNGESSSIFTAARKMIAKKMGGHPVSDFSIDKTSSNQLSTSQDAKLASSSMMNRELTPPKPTVQSIENFKSDIAGNKSTFQEKLSDQMKNNNPQKGR